MGKLRITLTGSLIGRLPNQIKTANSLGLRRIGDSKLHDDSPATAGKIKVVTHLVSVEREG